MCDTPFIEGPQFFGERGFLCPWLKNQKFKNSENQKCSLFLIFRCRYLPGIRLREKQRLGTWILRIRQIRVFESRCKLGEADFPIQGEFYFPIN